LKLTRYTEILDHAPGRITLRISFSGLGQLLEGIRETDFSAIVASIPGLKGYCASLIWRSVEIDYDPGVLPDDLWCDLVAAGRKPEMKEGVVKRLEALFDGKQRQRCTRR
jgi:hypothetical protein